MKLSANPGRQAGEHLDLFELTRALVSIESVTGNEQACGNFLRGVLEARGLQVEMQPVEETRAH